MVGVTRFALAISIALAPASVAGSETRAPLGLMIARHGDLTYAASLPDRDHQKTSKPSQDQKWLWVLI